MKSPDKVNQPSLPIDEQAPQGPMSRWSRRKQAVQEEQRQLEREAEAQKVQQELEAQLPTDADMPDIDTLTEDSDFSGFLSPKVSESLRRVALRKLFHSPGFNMIDGLDDYDEDFTSFAKLGDILTADMKHQMEVEARKKLELAQSEDEAKEPDARPSESDDLASQELSNEAIDEDPDPSEQVTDDSTERLERLHDINEEEDPELG